MLTRCIVWMWWWVWYTFIHNPKNLKDCLIRDGRLWMRKDFKPYLYRQNERGIWFIWLHNNASYSERRTLEVDCEVCLKTGRVIGLKLFDSQLMPKEKGIT